MPSPTAPQALGIFDRLNRLLFRIGRKRLTHGVELAGPVCLPSLAQYALDRVEAAVELIAACDPLRLDRLRRDMPRVLIGVPEVGDACFSPGTGLGVLNLEVVSQKVTTPAQLALLIVHEATHARLHRAGVEYVPELRARIERACVRAELAFAERLPAADRQTHVHSLRAWLEAPPPDFSDEAFIERSTDEARRSGHPEWFVALTRRNQLRALKRQRAQARE